MKKATPTQATLDEWLAYWQAELRLRDWVADVQLVFRDRIESAWPALGLCHHVLQHKIAHIWLLHPEEYDRDWQIDVEHTLVHELLHLHFAPFEYDTLKSLEGIAQEQTLNILAASLVKLKRAAK